MNPSQMLGPEAEERKIRFFRYEIHDEQTGAAVAEMIAERDQSWIDYIQRQNLLPLSTKYSGEEIKGKIPFAVEEKQTSPISQEAAADYRPNAPGEEMAGDMFIIRIGNNYLVSLNDSHLIVHPDLTQAAMWPRRAGARKVAELQRLEMDAELLPLGVCWGRGLRPPPRMDKEDLFIIQSGTGYLIEIFHDSPRLTSDVKEATRMPLAAAGIKAEEMEEIGFDAAIKMWIELKIAE